MGNSGLVSHAATSCRWGSDRPCPQLTRAYARLSGDCCPVIGSSWRGRWGFRLAVGGPHPALGATCAHPFPLEGQIAIGKRGEIRGVSAIPPLPRWGSRRCSGWSSNGLGSHRVIRCF